MIMRVTRVGEEMNSEALPEGEGRGKVFQQHSLHKWTVRTVATLKDDIQRCRHI